MMLLLLLRDYTDQKAMLLPLCNYLGIMLVGLIPMKKTNNNNTSSTSFNSSTSSTPTTTSSSPESVDFGGFDAASEDGDEPERTTQPLMMADSTELTRRQTIAELSLEDAPLAESSNVDIQVTPTKVYFSFSQVQLCIFVSVVLDFAGCIFSNIGLSMAGSGLYQGASG